MQLARRAVFPPGEAREDWRIIRALSGVLDHPLPFDTLGELRSRMSQAYPILAETDRVGRATWGAFGAPGPVDPTPFVYPIMDFYRTDPISRASETMAQCSEIYLAQRRQGPVRTGAHG